jgi:UDP:flavonoid glycosyltransferase YjiC (YdhE family)
MGHTGLVTHYGGAVTAHQVIREGIPSIVIAAHLDQEYN